MDLSKTMIAVKMKIEKAEGGNISYLESKLMNSEDLKKKLVAFFCSVPKSLTPPPNFFSRF